MEEEPYQESNSRAPLYILAAATVVLVVVGIVSFTKFVAAQKDADNNPLSSNSSSPQVIDPELTETVKTGTKVRGSVIDFSEEWNFVTMNIGSEHSVKEGDEFYVAREEIIKGIVKVDQVFPNESIALFVTDNDFSEYLAPKKGDEIRDLK